MAVVLSRRFPPPWTVDEPDALLQKSTRLQPAYRLDQPQPRPYCSLGIVFVGLRVSEVDQHAIA
jgi:hypothetical protein